MVQSFHFSTEASKRPSKEAWQSWLDQHSPGNHVTEIYWDDWRGSWVIQTTCGFWLE